MIYTQLFLTFFKIGLFSFGGGYAMLPLIQQEIVANSNWLTLSEFIDLVAISQVTLGLSLSMQQLLSGTRWRASSVPWPPHPV